MSESLADYAKQKIAKDNIAEGRKVVLEFTQTLIDIGLPLEVAVLLWHESSKDKVASGELTKASVFLCECWIREAYEKAGKE